MFAEIEKIMRLLDASEIKIKNYEDAFEILIIKKDRNNFGIAITKQLIKQKTNALSDTDIVLMGFNKKPTEKK